MAKPRAYHITVYTLINHDGNRSAEALIESRQWGTFTFGTPVEALWKMHDKIDSMLRDIAETQEGYVYDEGLVRGEDEHES